MATGTLREAFVRELSVKAVIWGPSIAATMLLGPVGLLVGTAVSVAILASGSDNSPQPPSG